MRKLGCIAHAAEFAIKILCDLCSHGPQWFCVQLIVIGNGLRLERSQDILQLLALAADLVPVFGKVCGNALQQIRERWHAVTRFFRKVGAGEERPLIIGINKHGQRPAAGSLRQ